MGRGQAGQERALGFGTRYPGSQTAPLPSSLKGFGKGSGGVTDQQPTCIHRRLSSVLSWGRDAEPKTAPRTSSAVYPCGAGGSHKGEDACPCSLPRPAAPAPQPPALATAPARLAPCVRCSSSGTGSTRSSSPCPKGKATSLPPPRHAAVPGAKARPCDPSQRGHFVRPLARCCTNGFIYYKAVGEEDISEKLAN